MPLGDSNRGVRRPARPLGDWVPLRGASGRLYGYYNAAGQVIEVKRRGEVAELIHLPPNDERKAPS